MKLHSSLLPLLAWSLVAVAVAVAVSGAEPVPEKLVVLTFDDSVASHHSVARPLLKKYGFGATFFITEGFSFRTNKKDYMTWEQIAELHRDGFEIGNHTRDHLGITAITFARLAEQLEGIDARCREHGIPRPISFAWPGNAFHTNALSVLRQAGIRFARRGGEPEVPYKEGGGIAFEPGLDHPLLIPTTGDARPDWSLDSLKQAVARGGKGRIAVLQFHGVPDHEHPWVNTPREKFEEYMAWLHREGYRVIALRDVARFVDEARMPDRPLEIMDRRRKERARLAGLNAYWAEVARSVREGDFEGYRATCHPEGVLVSGSRATSYPLAKALEGWKQGFVDTKAGRRKATVEFRFGQRWGDETTAHETGIFRYVAEDGEGHRQESFVHLEALLVRQDSWRMLMEHQKAAATPDDWNRLSDREP